MKFRSGEISIGGKFRLISEEVLHCPDKVKSSDLKLSKEHEEVVQKKDYSNLNEIESELEEIQKKTKSTDPNSAFAIAMSAKHKTLTKR